MDSRDSNSPQSQRSNKKWKGKEKMDAYQDKDSQVQPPIPKQLCNNTTSDESQKKIIAEFFYENNVSPYAVTSRSFRNLLDLGGNGALLQNSIPTVHELRERILYNEVRAMGVHVQEMNQMWQLMGCSIVLDGWDDAQGRKMMNILVDCPSGVVYLRSFEISPSFEDLDKTVMTFDNVINEVGIDNILQVISYTTSEPWLDVVGNWIKERHRSFFWSISAPHCLSLMLERVASSISWVQDTIAQAKRITRLVYSNPSLLGFMTRTNIESSHGRHVLVVPSKIRAAMPFLTLEEILLRRKDLRLMFCSQEWVQSQLGLSPRGREVSALVGDKSFWFRVTDIVRGSIPIVKVLNLFNNANNDKNIPHMGIVYETIDQMKETIRQEIDEEKAEEFWGIIDEIWNKILHCPLHAAGYYLNPRIFYTDDFSADSEVTEGMLSTILKIGGTQVTQGIITEQLKLYENGFGSFSQGIHERNNFPPVEWWMRFGSHCPELQTLAMKVLGLTCNGASTYELRRDVAENLLAVPDRHPSYEWLKKFAFVSYNVHLKPMKQPGFKFEIYRQDIDFMDDWIVGEY